jgi:hypothetical protein
LLANPLVILIKPVGVEMWEAKDWFQQVQERMWAEEEETTNVQNSYTTGSF